MSLIRVGILGATSLVADSLIARLRDAYSVVPFSRGDAVDRFAGDVEIPLWISLVPVWVLPEFFATLAAHRAARVVALSSTSLFTKGRSSDPAEQALARRIADSEQQIAGWAQSRDAEWIILRPTLIYGYGRDRNVSEIARFVRRFGFFPIFGEANGLRQPVHVDDIAATCVRALEAKHIANRTYNISGGETLKYRDMVIRVFDALGRRPRLIKVPLRLFQLGFPVARAWPRFRHWSFGMAERMNQDLVFDHAAAACDFGVVLRPFRLGQVDLPT